MGAYNNFVSEGDSGLPAEQLGDAIRAMGQVPTVAQVKDLQEKCNVSGMPSLTETCRVVLCQYRTSIRYPFELQFGKPTFVI